MSTDQEKLLARILLHNKLLDEQNINDLLLRAAHDPELAIKILVKSGKLSEGKGRLVTKVYREQSRGLKLPKTRKHRKASQGEASTNNSFAQQQRVINSKSENSRAVFISYSSEDKVVADAVCKSLESRNIGCWVAHRDIAGGERWTASIIDALSKAKAMVLILSNRSMGSPHVHRELERAVEKNIDIIPLRIENISLTKEYEYLLSTTQWLDAFGPIRDTQYAELANRIKHLLSEDSLRSHASNPNPVINIRKTKSAKQNKSYSGFATASRICGVLGIIFCIPGILALIFGVIALVGMSRSGNMKGHASAIAGLILGITEVVIFSIFLLISLFSGQQ